MANKPTFLKNSPKSIFSGQTIPDSYQNIEGLKNSTSYVANNDGSILVGSMTSVPVIPNPTTTSTTTTTTTAA
jgi:hypothetical protein